MKSKKKMYDALMDVLELSSDNLVALAKWMNAGLQRYDEGSAEHEAYIAGWRAGTLALNEVHYDNAKEYLNA